MKRGGRRGIAVAACVLGLLGGSAAPSSAEEQREERRFDGTFEIPDSEVTVKLGGFIDLAFIHDFDAIGNEDVFDPRTIPTDGSDGENTNLHAKWSRIALDIGRPTRRGRARIYLEGDFFGSGTSLRLRHGYGEVGPLLAGQTWSTFMDEDALPPTLDLDEPRGIVLQRHGMIRWTVLKNQSFLVALALEEPNASIEPAAGASGESEDPLPDFAIRTRRVSERGHLQLSGFVGKARFREDGGAEEDETLWGLSLSGLLAAGSSDKIRFQLSHGDGLARQRGGTAVATGADGRLEAIPGTAAVLSLQHFWSERLSSHLVYSLNEQDNTVGQAPDSIKRLDYAALNLVWEMAEGVHIGGEWLYGSREDKSGASGDANRLLVTFRYELF